MIALLELGKNGPNPYVFVEIYEFQFFCNLTDLVFAVSSHKMSSGDGANTTINLYGQDSTQNMRYMTQMRPLIIVPFL